MFFVPIFAKKIVMRFISSVSLWLKAARPKTLPASLSPVLLGCALAYRDNGGMLLLIPAVLCFLVALFAQIASNFANDYFDFKKGADGADRLGPERAVAQGWIKPKDMLKATVITLVLACLFGCMLIPYGGWELIPVGLAIAVCVLAYSTGPYPLAYNGLGDVCVLLFYGIVPVCFTYYVQCLHFSLLSLLLSIALGVLSVNILIVNNYRDYYQDKAVGKRTSIVIFGRTFGKYIYLLNGIIAVALIFPLLLNASIIFILLFSAFFVLFVKSWIDLSRLEGRALNKVLGDTARNEFVFALILSLFLIFGI